jgi:hypothetical protein
MSNTASLQQKYLRSAGIVEVEPVAVRLSVRDDLDR